MEMRALNKLSVLELSLGLLLLTSFSAHANLEDLIFVEGTYEQFAGEAYSPIISAGNNDALDDAPSTASGDYKLVSSTVGLPYPNTIGWTNPNATGGQPQNAAESFVMQGESHVLALQSLFESYYKNSDPATPDSVYLAYDFFLYDETSDQIDFASQDSYIDPSSNTRVDIKLFDTIERDTAKELLFTALQLDPYMTFTLNAGDADPSNDKEIAVANLLLDISYYESVSYIMKGNLALEKAFTYRFAGEALANNNQPILNELKELGWLTAADGSFSETDGAWYWFIKAAEIWRDVIKSPIQREMFAEWAALRDLDYLSHPAFTNANDTIDQEVFDGYKDAAVVYKSLAQRAKILNEVAKRLVLTLERDRAAEIISEIASQLAVEEAFWFEFLFDGQLPDDHTDKYPGLATSLYELKGNLTNVSKLRALAVNPELNGLGFDKNVLFIKAQDAGQTDFRPTYDWFSTTLFREGGAPDGALNNAILADQAALETRKSFLHQAVDYLSQYEALGNEYDTQLIAITGAGSFSGEPNFDTPETGGGLLEQQIGNIELARNEIERIVVQMDNIEGSVRIEQNRLAQQLELTDKRIAIIDATGNEVGQIQQEISNIQGDMAFASSMAAAVSAHTSTDSIKDFFTGGAASGFSMLAHTTNAFVQKELNRKIGQKQEAITRLQTEKEAQFAYLSSEQDAIDSAALIQNMFLDMRVLQIDLINSQIRLAQEMDRLVGYYDQIELLRNQKELSELRLVQRNFVDPSYRIEVTNAALQAEKTFASTQRWIYLMLQALEYKWPLTGEGKNLEINSIRSGILQSRTAKELEEILTTEISGFDHVQSYAQAFYYSSFSLRDDHFNFDIGNSSTEAANSFVEHLQGLAADPANIVELSNGTQYLAVDFSTVKFDLSNNNFVDQIPITVDGEGGTTTTETANPRPLFSDELWDNKVSWVQVNVNGNNIYEFNSQQLPIQLWYGGTGYLRTKEAFCVDATDEEGNPVRVKADYRDYAKPAYEFSLSGGELTWIANDFIKQQVNAKLVSNPRNIPDYTFQFNAFAERPVASSGWKILLPLNGLNIANIFDIELTVVSKARTVNRASEPSCNI
jgi:hypothetical protein